MQQKNVITGVDSIKILNDYPLMNENSVDKLKKKNNRLFNIGRNLPPTKGIFLSLQKDFGTDYVLNWTNKIKKELLSSIKSKASHDHAFDGLVSLEEFQEYQKGPVAPIPKDQLVSVVIPKIFDNSLNDLNKLFDEHKLEDYVQEVNDILEKKGFTNSVDIKSINFSELWRQLPSSSVRGIPFLDKGANVDDEICIKLGSDHTSVLKWFNKLTSLIATPALRFQGSKGKEVAKVRLVNIPCCIYNYFMNGIYKTMQPIFKTWDCFAAWDEPNNRDKRLNNMVNTCLSNNWRMLSLDYRMYDQCLCPSLRFAATKLIFNCIKDFPDKDKVLDTIKLIYHNQYICVPYGNDPLTLLKVDNLLMSGVSNTQLDGSIINLILQRFIAHRLGYSIPTDLGLALGDDTGLPIPVEIIEKYGGYEAILKYIKEEILNPLGMDSHDKKAYPNDNLLFLQNLYQPQDQIIAQYSTLRSVDSLVWAEQYRTKIPEIKNNNALETIGQITIVNNPWISKGKVNEKDEVTILLRRWLELDKSLLKLCSDSLSRNNPENYLMNYLIAASGGKDAIVRAFRLKQSDNKGILGRLNSGSFKEAFPVLTAMLEVANSMPKVNIDIASVYEQKTSPEFDTPDMNSQVNQEDFV